MELSKFRVTCDRKQQAQLNPSTWCSKGHMFSSETKFYKVPLWVFWCLVFFFFLNKGISPWMLRKKIKPEPQDLAGNYNMNLNEI